MATLAQYYYIIHNAIFSRLKYLDGLPPLALRLYLVPVFWMAGTQKIAGMDNTIEWFGNPDWGLGLPFPALLAYLAAYTEAIGALLLLLGLATRWISIPLMITMLVAIFAVHADKGLFLPNGYEFGLALLAASLSLMISGAGRLSVDQWLATRSTR